MEINLQGNFKLRFDPNEVRVNIDGEKIDVGARRKEEKKFIIKDFDNRSLGHTNYHSGTDKTLKSEDILYRFESTDGNEFSDSVELLEDDHYYRDNKTDGSSIHSGAYLKRRYGPKEGDSPKR